jgi:hypothetical protein
MSRVDAITTNLRWDLSVFSNLVGTTSVEENVLVEDGDTTQRTAFPFRVVFLEFWINGLQERSYEGFLEGRAYDTAFVPKVHDYKR